MVAHAAQNMVLMYHRVIDVDVDPWGLCVSLANFEDHMKILKKLGQPLACAQMTKRPENINFGVTFDDGYADNFRLARPILEKHGIPATFFIVSGMVGKKEEFWWDELERAVLAANKLPAQFDLSLAGKNYRWNISGTSRSEPSSYEKVTEVLPEENADLSPLQLYYALWEVLSRFSKEEKKKSIEQIKQWSKETSLPRADFLPMTQTELLALSKHSLFEIGAHTISHPMLARKSVAEQREEIGGSKNTLQSLLGREIHSFSCPHGSYSDDTVAIFKELGFRYVCTSRNRNIKEDSDCFLVPRRFIPNWDGAEFEKQIKRWMDS